MSALVGGLYFRAPHLSSLHNSLLPAHEQAVIDGKPRPAAPGDKKTTLKNMQKHKHMFAKRKNICAVPQTYPTNIQL